LSAVKPFEHARAKAREIRLAALNERAEEALESRVVVSSVVEHLDLDVVLTDPDDPSLCGADALLRRELNQVLVRRDVSDGEQAFLIAHEIGHLELHAEGSIGCHHVLAGEFRPAEGVTFAAERVEAYGARERAELQANVFAREMLLPREVAKCAFVDGANEQTLAFGLKLPLELLRLQLIDGMLLPSGTPREERGAAKLIWTKEQRKPACSTARHSLVVAGPGTGKTATLLFRIKHLIEDLGVTPASILALTFSNRAARELQGRLKEQGIGAADEIWVGTFHSFGLDFLRRYHDLFSLTPTFSVLDKLGQIALLEPNLHEAGLEAFDPLGDPLDWLTVVVDAIQRLKDELKSPDDYLRLITFEEGVCGLDIAAQRWDAWRLYTLYEALKARTGRLVDLGDLVMLPTLALEQDRSRFRDAVGRLKHVLVDEYQDVNRASARLVKALSAEADALWVVGDPRQAIYRFRGASMRNVIRFGEDFPGYKRFELLENRRSTEEIIRLFEHTGRDHPLQGTLPLEDVGATNGASGTRPVRLLCASELAMWEALRESVQQARGRGTSYRDQAVIASTHDVCGRAATALAAAGIPALYLGNIFEREEIKDLLSLLQLVVDDTGSALVRVARFPAFAATAKHVPDVLRHLSIKHALPPGWDELLGQTFPPKVRDDFSVLLKAMSSYRRSDAPWDVLCSLLVGEARLVVPYLAGDDIQALTQRMAIWQFLHFTRTPDGTTPYQTIPRFLASLRRRIRVGDDRELRLPPPEAEALDAVAILTVHGSKGLEFEFVHFVDVDAWHFERPDKASALLPASLWGEADASRLDEPRVEAANRLYVALSRAKGQLYLYENQDRYNAAPVAAIAAASALYDTRTVSSEAPQPAPAATAAGSTVIDVPDVHFVRFLICPRKYHYECAVGVEPAIALPDSVRVESAVMQDLFARAGATGTELLPPGSLDALVRQLELLDLPEAAHLARYGAALLANGRAWLGCERGQLPKMFSYQLGPLRIRVQSHQTLIEEDLVTVRFFRARPTNERSPQMQFLRWTAREVSRLAKAKSVRFELAILSTGDLRVITPYSDRADHLEETAERLAKAEFDARPSARNCARCRHFSYCPA
jgi:superfamily I DNA/RNA helicase/Zn-dependent peptidase ImmA (M78 family)